VSAGVPQDQRDFGPPYLKGFFVVLPDAIPVPNGSSWTFYTNEREPSLDGMRLAPVAHARPNQPEEQGYNFVSIRFLQVDDNTESDLVAEHTILTRAVDRIVKASPTDSALPSSPPLDRHRTVVEMVTFVASAEDLVATVAKQDPLTRCLTELFKFHRAYRVLAKLCCEELTYKRLHPLVITTRRRLADTKPVADGIALLDMRPNRIGALNEHIGSVDFSVVTAVYARGHAGDPLISYLERVVDAKHAYIELGKNSDAAVQLATACEVLLDGLLGMILFESGSTTDHATEIFSKDVVPRVKQDYQKLVGGNWSLATGAVGEWYEKVAGLRNRVVHAGYRPTDIEVSTSFDAVDGLANHTMDRLFDRSHQYPITAWLFLGPQQFEKRGGVPRRVRATVDAQAGGLTAQIARYSTWRESVNIAVQRRRITA
jgi:hypothetical protein